LSVGVASLTSPEAGNNQRFPLQRPIEVDWSSPVSSKLLLEGTAMHRIERWGAMDPGADLAPGMISVTDNGPGAFRPGMTYRAAGSYSNNLNTTFHYRLAASYITGAHAFKVGFNDAWGQSDATTYTRSPYSFQFNGSRRRVRCPCRLPSASRPIRPAPTSVTTPGSRTGQMDDRPRRSLSAFAIMPPATIRDRRRGAGANRTSRSRRSR
jgi:hypothetical protein